MVSSGLTVALWTTKLGKRVSQTMDLGMVKTVLSKMDKAFGMMFHVIIPGRMLFVENPLCTSGVKFQDQIELTVGIQGLMLLHVSVSVVVMTHLTDTTGVSIQNRPLRAKVRVELDGIVNVSITGKKLSQSVSRLTIFQIQTSQ